MNKPRSRMAPWRCLVSWPRECLEVRWRCTVACTRMSCSMTCMCVHVPMVHSGWLRCPVCCHPQRRERRDACRSGRVLERDIWVRRLWVPAPNAWRYSHSCVMQQHGVPVAADGRSWFRVRRWCAHRLERTNTTNTGQIGCTWYCSPLIRATKTCDGTSTVAW